MEKFIQIFLLFYFSLFFGQNNFSKADSIAKSTKYNGNINELVLDLTTDFDNDFDKARSIYFWITENISYDYKLFNKGPQIVKFNCKSKVDCQIKKQEFESKLIHTVLRKKKAICSGYSTLFKRMCDIATIKSLNIDGYIKNKKSHIGNSGILDHAWNAIIIENKTYFLDPTWASGYCESDQHGKLNKFVKERNDFYWLTPVDKFTIDHFPKNPDKILNFDLTKEAYKNQPYIKSSIIPLISIENPKEGIIDAKLNDSIIFKFKYIEGIKTIQINTNTERNPKFYTVDKNGDRIFNEKAFNKQKYIPFKKESNNFEFLYIIKDQNLTYIEILFDYDLKLKYLVRIK